MAVNPALPVLITLIISLVPIAIYCMVLASVNRRVRPAMVRGIWDFAGVLFAVSGAVLWTGPTLLATLYERSVAREAAHTFDSVWLRWWFIWAAYYSVVVAGSVFLLWLRRSTTAVYNVQTNQVAGLIEATLRHLGYDFARNSQQQFLIAAVKKTSPGAMDAASAELPAFAEPSHVEFAPATYCTALEIEEFGPLSHVTMHWYETGPCLRDEIEAELQRHLANVPAVDNPAALWQFSVATLLFGAIFLSVLFVILEAVFPRR